MILADSLPEYASSNFAISSKSTESSNDTFLRFKSSRFLRAIRLGRPMRTLFSKRRRNASSISRYMWFNFSLDSLKFPFTRETNAQKKWKFFLKVQFLNNKFYNYTKKQPFGTWQFGKNGVLVYFIGTFYDVRY